MRDLHLVPGLLISSDAVRAAQTARAVAESAGYDGKIQYDARLYLAEPETYLDVLLEVAPKTESVLMVGHNPGISRLVSRLTGVDVEMPTAALAKIELSTADFSSLDGTDAGTLAGLWKPRDLD